jgi:hypothetical protein
MNRLISTTLLIALAASGTAVAAQHGPRMSFETLDTDGDGRLSAAELDALPARSGMSGAERLERMDADDDGYVSREELQAMGPGGKPGNRIRADFEALDADGDGRLSAAELEDLPVRGQATPAQRFAHLDADGDGYVTREELAAMPPRGGRPK